MEESFLAKAYRWLYTRAGGRPWTYIIRDEQKANPLLFLVIMLMLGVLLVKTCRQSWWQVMLGIAFGILLGHFWW